MWESSDMAETEQLRGRSLYEALMAIKPDGLPETEWAVKANINRGFFTNLKSSDINPRYDTLRKLLSVIGATDAMLHAGVAPEAADTPPTQSADVGDTVGITQLDLSLSMGPGTLIEDFVESEVVSFDASVLKRITRTPSDRLRFVTGIGTSHEPRFQHNDQFLIDINECRLSRLDGYYWITFDGAHALKRLRPLGGGRIQIISDNPEYGPQDVDANEVRIEGRAIWFARGL